MSLFLLLLRNFTLILVRRADKLIQQASLVYGIHKRVSSIPGSQGSPFTVVIFLPVLYYNQSPSFSKLPSSHRSFMDTCVSRNEPWFQDLNFSISTGLLPLPHLIRELHYP